MKIVIAGGSGQVGTILRRAFAPKHEVVVLSRAAEKGEGQVRMVPWDGERIGPWASELDGADVLINLAGRSVNCRYGTKNRREIIDSRVKSTRVLGQACTGLKSPPRVWLQASTATIYAHVPSGAAPHDEGGVIGGNEVGVPETWRFSIEVAMAWERAFDEVKLPNTRKVKLRSAMVMSPDAKGVFDTLLALVKSRLGGRAGDGRQYVSWIHERDFVRALEWIIEHKEFRGHVNICAPNPLTNEEFMRELREAAGVAFGLPATKWMLELGAVFIRTETELILKSRRVVPGWLESSGFEFEFPHWRAAARELCGRAG
ncbi:MAG: epimerase [Limisphaerales bacterium]